MTSRLYKYAKKRWATKLLDGEILFRSLAYYRDYVDANTRGDQNEGTAEFRPAGGLVVNNLTQGTTFRLPHAFASTAKQADIFVFCLSRSFNDELRQKFEAEACVEILDVPKFCARVLAALPPSATFPGPPGRRRIGHRVQYYARTEASNPRWALPDMIASSKLDDYAWQGEFRFVFTLTDAFNFENVKMELRPEDSIVTRNPAEHLTHSVSAGALRDICRLHEFASGK